MSCCRICIFANRRIPSLGQGGEYIGVSVRTMAVFCWPLDNPLQQAPALTLAVSLSFKLGNPLPGLQDDADELTGFHFVTY